MNVRLSRGSASLARNASGPLRRRSRESVPCPLTSLRKSLLEHVIEFASRGEGFGDFGPATEIVYLRVRRVSTRIRTCSSLGTSDQFLNRRERPVGDHDSHEVLQRIDALLPTLRERAQEAENLRRVPDDSIKELQEAGFFKLLQPAQWVDTRPIPSPSSPRCATSRARAARPDGSPASSASTTGTSHSSTSRPRKRSGATTPTSASPRPTRPWCR